MSLCIKRFFVQKKTVLDADYDNQVLSEFFADKDVLNHLEAWDVTIALLICLRSFSRCADPTGPT